jgi:hypothetical protein
VIRDGYVARWRDADYEAAPGVDGEVRLYATVPSEGFEEVRPGRFVQIVGNGEVASLRYVRTHCTWRGEPFVVIAEHDGWVRLEYSGGRAPVAMALGLDRLDTGVYQTWVARQEIEQLREENI